MSALFKLDVSPRGDHSVSRYLGKQFTEQWKKTHPGGKVIERDLTKTDLPFIDVPWITASASDPSTHNAEHKAALEIGDELIPELKAADEWVIATPMYNFGLPARLKAYIDHIVRAGHTFETKPDGSFSGLLTGKKVTIIIASAGEYKPGMPMEKYDTESPYLRTILGLMGITDLTFVRVGATWKVDHQLATFDDFVAAFEDEVLEAATAK